MTDRERDPHPDSPPEADHDRRSDLEQATTGTNRDIENVEEAEGADTPDAPEGADGAVGGNGGMTKNQDDTAQ